MAVPLRIQSQNAYFIYSYQGEHILDRLIHFHTKRKRTTGFTLIKHLKDL